MADKTSLDEIPIALNFIIRLAFCIEVSSNIFNSIYKSFK